jgi:hypothetical protein
MNRVVLDYILSLELINVKFVSCNPSGTKIVEVAPTFSENLIKNNTWVGKQYCLITQFFQTFRLSFRTGNKYLLVWKQN